MPNLTISHALLTLLILAGCASEESNAPAPPPPLPARPALLPPVAAAQAEAPAADAVATTENQPEAVVEVGKASGKARRGASLYDLDPSTRQGKVSAPAPSPKVDLPTPTPEPRPEPAPKPTPSKSFSMPGSAHVRIDAPAGLLSDLGKDSRMQPWLSQGVVAATKCYEREAKTNAGLSGTVVVSIVMHESDRPDASLQALPSQLSGMFACLTGSMMKSRMPLFTGHEGQKYTARVTFAP